MGLLLYVSSAARASELLAVGLEDIDWAGRIWVISQGTRDRRDIPADPEAFIYLANGPGTTFGTPRRPG